VTPIEQICASDNVTAGVVGGGGTIRSRRLASIDCDRFVSVHLTLLTVDGGQNVSRCGIGRGSKVVELTDTIGVNQDLRPCVSMSDPIVGDDACVVCRVAINNQVASSIEPVDVITDEPGNSSDLYLLRLG
jgi:hypothetical protein